MTARPMVLVKADAVRNLARVCYYGHVTVEGMLSALAQIESLLPQLRKGFVVLTDLSGLDSMDLECVAPLTKIMDRCLTAGIGTVIRVVPDSTKDIGFNILSIIHYHGNVQIVTCETLEEAERALKA